MDKQAGEAIAVVVPYPNGRERRIVCLDRESAERCLAAWKQERPNAYLDPEPEEPANA